MPDVTLRDQCVEAAAESYVRWDGWVGPGPPVPIERDRKAAREILDAILDTLEANADEWDEVALHLATSETPPYSMIGSFIAALRIPNVEEETR